MMIWIVSAVVLFLALVLAMSLWDFMQETSDCGEEEMLRDIRDTVNDITHRNDRN